MSSGGVLRVGIPASFRKTIQDIKEIAGKHSDEDIYVMLKECNMDPNETAQKLLYLDTFHEVKRKRDRRKMTVSNQVTERNRWAPGMQWRGARGGRGYNSSGYSSNDTGGGQRIGPPKENGSTVQRPTSATGLAVPVHHNTKSDAVSSNDKSTSLVSGSSMQESTPHHSEGNIVKSGQGTRPSLPKIAIKLLNDMNPGPTPTPTPTTTFNTESEAGFADKKPETTSGDISASKPASGVYASASDPVLLPSLNLRNPGAVGTIKRETGIQKIAPENSDTSLPEIRLNINLDGGKTDQVDHITIESNRKTFHGVEKDRSSEPSKSASLVHDNTNPTVPQHGLSSKQVNGSSNVMTHMDQAISQLNRKLEDLNITSQKSVIFPDHVHVPEAFRNGLTFGSLDRSFGHEISATEDVKLVDGTLSNEDGESDTSLSHEIAATTAREGEYPTNLQSFTSMSPNLPVLEVNNPPPSAPPLSELSKPEIMPPVGRSPYSFLPTAPEYGFSMMPPPMLAPHHVQVEETEISNSSVSSASVSAQALQPTPIGHGQTSATVSPPLFPYLRQPYPSNYFPYNPYLPHLYMPPNAPQFFGHGGFPQQASSGNIYMPPPATGTGVKFPIPQIYKPGTVATNLTHFGIPSGYGSYGSSMLGYGIAASVTPPGSSSSTEDLTAPELKEKNMYSVMKQNEDSHVWTSAPTRDVQSLQANFFYNFPHGQPVTYSPAPSGQQGSLAGMYHLTTPTTAAAPPPLPPPSIAQSLPQHSQQIMMGSADTSTGTYQQPHSHAGWNPKLLNRDNI